MKSSKKVLKQTQRLLGVVSDLRKKCPWDRKQTHRSLLPYLIEEAYEAVDAIEKGDMKAVEEELGDLLLQVALHAEIASEKKKFNFESVAAGISDKMIRRHPHIYEKKAYRDLKTHLSNWTKLKAKEKPKKFLLEGIPRALPGVQLAQRYGEIAASVGFDCARVEDWVDKVQEELAELKTELRRRRPRTSQIEMELGDVFFSLANLARHLKISSDRAARKSAFKFGDRFTRLEKEMRRKGRRLEECSRLEMDALWERIKKR